MNPPKVSVIIPAYNHGMYIGAAIRSVLAQSYPHLELIVVDDGSTDGTASIVAQFDDSRLQFIRQPNGGLPSARNTGIRASNSQYLAFLDADDLFHPDKLKRQIAVLESQPHIGLLYHARMEVTQDDRPIWLCGVPTTIDIRDLMLGFPFTANDFIVRRKWVTAVSGFDESFRLHGEDRDFYLRLSLAGCTFAGIEDFLSYRRVHFQRTFSKIPQRLAIMLRALDIAFAHPAFPQDKSSIRPLAYSKLYLIWSFHEFVQDEITTALSHLKRAIHLNPQLIEYGGQAIKNEYVWAAFRIGVDHEALLHKIARLLPTSLSAIGQQLDPAIRHGYFLHGMRALIWESEDIQAPQFFEKAIQNRGEIPAAGVLTEQLRLYEVAFGTEAVQSVIKRLIPLLEQFSSRKETGRVMGRFTINRAFSHYEAHNFSDSIRQVRQALRYNPSYISNRGVISILARSLWCSYVSRRPAR